ncbi:MAG: O-antigen ligase family protein [Nitrospirota bacterium]
MGNIKTRGKLHFINIYLIMLLGFSIPISTSISSIIPVLIFLLWLIEGDFKNKLNKIIENRAILAFILLFSLYLVGLLYTTDLENGLYLVRKGRYLLLTPLIYTAISNEKEKGMAIKSFIAGVICSVFISYLIYFKIVKFNNISPSCPAIIHYGHYSIHLAFAIFWLLNSFFKNSSKYLKIAVLLVVVLMSINLFIQYSRGGQLAFFVLIILWTIKRYGIKGMLCGIIIVCILSTCIYRISPTFKQRIDIGIEDITQFQTKDKLSGVGERLIFWQNTFKIIKSNPIIGVGTGDFNVEYAKINQQKDKLITDNPHNNYLFILALFGVIGFIIFLNLFYQMFRYSLLSPNGEIVQLLIVTISILMLFESPLMRHGMLYFVYLSGVLLNKGKVD